MEYEEEKIKSLIQKIENVIYLKNGKILIPMHKITIAYVGADVAKNEDSKVNGLQSNLAVVNVDPVSYLLSDGDKIEEMSLKNLKEDTKWLDLITIAVKLLKKT